MSNRYPGVSGTGSERVPKHERMVFKGCVYFSVLASNTVPIYGEGGTGHWLAGGILIPCSMWPPPADASLILHDPGSHTVTGGFGNHLPDTEPPGTHAQPPEPH